MLHPLTGQCRITNQALNLLGNNLVGTIVEAAHNEEALWQRIELTS